MPVTFQKSSGAIAVGVDETRMAEVQATLAAVDGGAERAVVAAINDTLKYARTQITRQMREHLNLNAGEIRDRIQIRQQASEGHLEGVLRIDYRPVPLEDFKARFRRKSGAGVSVTTVKEQGVQVFKHQFRATMASGHTGIFERVAGAAKVNPGSGRYAGRQIRRGPRKGQPILRQPIKETFGPSILRAFELAPGLADEALHDISAKLEERLVSKVEWQLSKASPDVPLTV